MPAQRLPMRKIRDALRLKFANGLSERQIAASLGISKTTVNEYLRRARQAGLSWPLPEGLGEDALYQQLFPPAPEDPRRARPLPDWPAIWSEAASPASRCACCGRNTGPSIPTATG